MADTFKIGEEKRAKGEYVEAVLNFKMSADTGYIPAILALAQAYEKGQGVPKNLDQASALYKLAAEKGEAAAAADASRTKIEAEKVSLSSAPAVKGADRWDQAPKTTTLGRRAGKQVFAATQALGP